MENIKADIAFISYVTHSSHLNYGATLHGYAFQKVLNLMGGGKNIVIDYLPVAVESDNLKYPILNKEKGRNLTTWCAVKANYLMSLWTNIEKFNKFKRFIDTKMAKTSKLYSHQELAECTSLPEDPDIFVCESDVIWKYLDGENFDENFFLSFPAAKGKRKVAYAPTISAHALSDTSKAKLIDLVSEFDAISSREEEGGKYLSKILNREIPWVLDPTLLLDEKDYEDIIQRPKENNYLMIYNCTVNDRAMVKEACRYAKEHNLKVIEISNYAINSLSPWHEVKCNVGIEEWLGYIKYSSVFCTNSFHGLCFAIIFKKGLFLFQRDRNDHRMPNLINKFGMNSCFIEVEDRRIPETSQAVNYDEVYKRLSVYRKKSIEFIKKHIIDSQEREDR